MTFILLFPYVINEHSIKFFLFFSQQLNHFYNISSMKMSVRWKLKNVMNLEDEKIIILFINHN